MAAAKKGPAALAELQPGGGLDLNDFVELEERYGPLDLIDFTQLRVIRTVFWLVYRHDEPGLTELEAGAKVKAEELIKDSRAILRRSGLIPEGEPRGNAPAPAGATSTGS